MLRDLQSDFRRALLMPQDAVPFKWIQAQDNQEARTRFTIHQTNVRASLITALQAAFPAVSYYAGEGNFAYAAGRFIEAWPPRLPQLSRYGAEFPGFLETFTPAQNMPWLVDLARLEWACQESLFAADAQVFELVQMTQLEALPAPRLFLHPSLRVVSSPYPIMSLWEEAMISASKNKETGHSPLDRSGEDVLLVRPKDDVEFYRLSPSEAAFVAAIDGGESLQEALQTAYQVDARQKDTEPGKDLAYMIATLVARGCFKSFD